MATLQVLGTAYSDVARIKYANIPTADLAKLQTLADQVDASTLSLADARAEIGKMVSTSTSVATLSYAFFAGYTPKMMGLDYLVSPTGGNANNLNSAYYQSFNSDNRYINFAVNLGKNGEGATRFAAAYGALNLTDATSKAWFASAWRDKLFAGFTNSASVIGDKTATLNYFMTLAMQHGGIWVGTGMQPANTKAARREDLNWAGVWSGATSVSPMDASAAEMVQGDLDFAFAFGQRVAEVARRWAAGAK